VRGIGRSPLGLDLHDVADDTTNRECPVDGKMEGVDGSCQARWMDQDVSARPETVGPVLRGEVRRRM
jgi:hypothetical protein